MDYLNSYKPEAIAKLEGEIAQLREKQKAHPELHDAVEMIVAPKVEKLRWLKTPPRQTTYASKAVGDFVSAWRHRR
jgi:hypothetical protein